MWGKIGQDNLKTSNISFPGKTKVSNSQFSIDFWKTMQIAQSIGVGFLAKIS
jgi:hypothetical protein